jgi:hypothetical protein
VLFVSLRSHYSLLVIYDLRDFSQDLHWCGPTSVSRPRPPSTPSRGTQKFSGSQPWLHTSTLRILGDFADSIGILIMLHYLYSVPSPQSTLIHTANETTSDHQTHLRDTANRIHNRKPVGIPFLYLHDVPHSLEQREARTKALLLQPHEPTRNRSLGDHCKYLMLSHYLCLSLQF